MELISSAGSSWWSCLILGLLQTETVCSIVRPYVRVYSHLALNGTITLYFQTSEQQQSGILTAFVVGEKRVEQHQVCL